METRNKKMETRVIINQIEKLSLDEIASIHNEVRKIYREKYYATYYEVEIYNYAGNITSRIQQETGLSTYWTGEKGRTGTNVVKIPKAEYSEAEYEKVSLELKKKYENIH